MSQGAAGQVSGERSNPPPIRRMRAFDHKTLGEVPWRSTLVTFIWIRPWEAGETHVLPGIEMKTAFANLSRGKMDMLSKWREGDIILVAWPGKWSQDIFQMSTDDMEFVRTWLEAPVRRH